MYLPSSKFRPDSGRLFDPGACCERAENAKEFSPKPISPEKMAFATRRKCYIGVLCPDPSGFGV